MSEATDTAGDAEIDAAPSGADAEGDDLGLDPDEFQAAAETLAREAEELQDDTEADAEHANGEPDEDGEPASAREARYRVRAREAESRLADAAAENSRLLDELDRVRRSQAESLAADRLADPAGDLFREHGLDTVLADDGTVDPVKVDKLCASLISEHPHWGIARPAVNPNALRSGARKADEAPVPSWQRAFAPRAK
jgi:hypothetical protein